jgi:hypothetical protein
MLLLFAQKALTKKPEWLGLNSNTSHEVVFLGQTQVSQR